MRLAVLLLSTGLWATPKEVAITIDDLPRGGDDASALDMATITAMTKKLLGPLRGTRAIGFVNPGRNSAESIGAEGLQRVLRQWRQAGLDLGNHTQTHPNINQTPLADYTADIVAAEPAITRALGHRPLYFRHPFLFTGKDAATRAALSRFLEEHNYRVAPVTVDNSDWMFAAVYAEARKRSAAEAARVRGIYLAYMETMFAFWEAKGREIAGEDFPQILLIHANQLNADAMPDLLAMMRRRGYRFVSLQRALRHRAYQLADGYTGPWGISWIRRWALAKGIKITGEPEEPKEIADAFAKLKKATAP